MTSVFRCGEFTGNSWHMRHNTLRMLPSLHAHRTKSVLILCVSDARNKFFNVIVIMNNVDGVAKVVIDDGIKNFRAT